MTMTTDGIAWSVEVLHSLGFDLGRASCRLLAFVLVVISVCSVFGSFWGSVVLSLLSACVVFGALVVLEFEWKWMELLPPNPTRARTAGGSEIRS